MSRRGAHGGHCPDCVFMYGAANAARVHAAIDKSPHAASFHAWTSVRRRLFRDMDTTLSGGGLLSRAKSAWHSAMKIMRAINTILGSKARAIASAVGLKGLLRVAKALWSGLVSSKVGDLVRTFLGGGGAKGVDGGSFIIRPLFKVLVASMGQATAVGGMLTQGLSELGVALNAVMAAGQTTTLLATKSQIAAQLASARAASQIAAQLASASSAAAEAGPITMTIAAKAGVSEAAMSAAATNWQVAASHMVVPQVVQQGPAAKLAAACVQLMGGTVSVFAAPQLAADAIATIVDLCFKALRSSGLAGQSDGWQRTVRALARVVSGLGAGYLVLGAAGGVGILGLPIVVGALVAFIVLELVRYATNFTRSVPRMMMDLTLVIVKIIVKLIMFLFRAAANGARAFYKVVANNYRSHQERQRQMKLKQRDMRGSLRVLRQRVVAARKVPQQRARFRW